MDFAEQIESVAYVLCGEGTIVFDKFVSIWKARGVSALFYHWNILHVITKIFSVDF